METERPDAKAVRFAVEEARRLHREAGMAWLWKLLMPITGQKRREEIRRTASYVRLERASAASRHRK